MYYVSKLTNKEKFLGQYGSHQSNAAIYKAIGDEPFICSLDPYGNADLIYAKGKWHHNSLNNEHGVCFSVYSTELKEFFEPLVKEPTVKEFDSRREARAACKANPNVRFADKSNVLPGRWTVVPKEIKCPTKELQQFKWQKPVGARPNEGFEFSEVADYEVSHLSVIRLIESKREDFIKRNSVNEEFMDVVDNKAFCGMISVDGYCTEILTGMIAKEPNDVGLCVISNFLTSVEMFECFEEIVLPSFGSRREARAYCDSDPRFQVFDLKKHEQDVIDDCPEVALSYGKQKNRWWCVPRSVD